MPLRELKDILMQRITSILQLQALFQPSYLQDNSSTNNAVTNSQPVNKYDLILQHKKLERYRSLRESQLLLTLNNCRISDQCTQHELYSYVVEICALYTPEFSRYKQFNQATDVRQTIRLIYIQFFTINGFKEKCQYINKLWEKDSSTVSSALFMGWLSQWSKKLYCELLQKEIEKSFMNKDKIPKTIQNGFTLGMFISKKKQNKNVIQGSFNQLSDVALSNRTNIQSFFLDELATLYKLTGIDQIDFTYLKTIKKRIGKQDLLQPPNLSKAVQAIIESSSNKQIQVSIKTYESSYNERYRKKLKLKNNLKKQIIQIKKPAPAISPTLSVCPPLSPIRKRQKTTTDSDQQASSKPKVLSPKTSQIEFIKLQEISNHKKIRVISNQKSIKNNLEFPGLILKKETFKQDMKSLSNMLSPISEANQAKSKKNDSLASLQKRMKQGDFLRCQSISAKFQSKNNPYSLLEDGQKDLCRVPTLKQSKHVEKHMDSEYDDHRIKISKMFELADLRFRKINAAFNRAIMEPAQ